ncbi:hypothetical protein Tco_0020537 [Tanacetum coccineum]
MSNDPLSQEIGLGDRPRCQEAMGVSLLRLGLRGHLNIPMFHLSQEVTHLEGLEQDDLTDFVPPTPYDSPLSGGHTPRSDEGRPNINELMAICTQLSNRVLALETSRTAQDLVIQKLKKKVKRLEKKHKARTPGMKLFKIGTSRRKSLDKENVSKQGRKSNKTKPMFDDSDFVELDVDNAIENVEGDAETQGRNIAEQITTVRDTVNTASIDVSAVGPSNVSTADPSTSTARDIFEDEMMTIADTLVAIRSTRPRITSLIIHDVEEEARRSTPAPTAQPSSKDKGKALMIAQRLFEEEQAQFEREQRIARKRDTEQEAKHAALIAEFEDVQARMNADALLAARLQEKEREQFSIDEQARFLVETIAERKRFFAAQRAEQIRNKPPTKTQLRNKMITYLKNMGRFSYNQLKNKSFEEIQKLYEKEQKWIKDFIPMDSEEGGKKAASSKKRPRAEPDEESVKRQKIGEASGSGEEQSAEKEKGLSEEELQKLLVVVPVEEVYVEALQVKYPIIDWEVYSEDTRRDDLVKLWDLVKKRFSTTEPTNDKEKELWVELKRLFEPDNDDIMWKLQRYMHDPLVWRLYDTCGVHHVSSEPVEEPSAEVVMDDTGDDVVHDDKQLQNASEPKIAKTPNPEWFTQPPRPPTPDLEWNKRQVVLDQPKQPWFNQMVSATKDPLTFNDLMATSIDFSKYVLNRLKIDNLTQDILLGPAYNLLKSTCHLGYLTVVVDYFFNNDLKYIKSSDLERTYTTSIMKTKAARYEIKGIEDMVPTLWRVKSVSVKKLHGYGHPEEIVVKRADRQLYKFKEGDFVDLHINDIEDMLFLVVQHKLFHLTDSDIVDFIMALYMFTRSLVIKKQVEDLQLGVESYQKKLNITPPQQTVLKFKEPYTPSHKPPGVIYKDLVQQKRVMCLMTVQVLRITLRKLRSDYITDTTIVNLDTDKEM